MIFLQLNPTIAIKCIENMYNVDDKNLIKNWIINLNIS